MKTKIILIALLLTGAVGCSQNGFEQVENAGSDSQLLVPGIEKAPGGGTIVEDQRPPDSRLFTEYQNYSCELNATTNEVRCRGSFPGIYGVPGGVVVGGITPDFKVAAINLGYNLFCLLSADGRVRCVNDGIMNPSRDKSSIVAVEIPNLRNVTQLSVGAYFGCALTAEKQVVCWGRNGEGQLGVGTCSQSKTPSLMISGSSGSSISENCDGKDARFNELTPVHGLNNVRQISAEGFHACALTETDELFCWGLNKYGELGIAERKYTGDEIYHAILGYPLEGHKPMSLYPIRVEIGDVAAVFTEQHNTCVTKRDGTIDCWGLGGGHLKIEAISTGSLFHYRTSYSPELMLKLPGVKKIVAQVTSYLKCFLHEDGTVSCMKTSGVDGAELHQPFGGEKFQDLIAGFGSVCVRDQKGLHKCFGYNSYGEYGQSRPANPSSVYDVRF